MYEVLLTESLYDVKEHISNIVTEIVAHLTDDEKKLCEDTLSLCQEQETSCVVQIIEKSASCLLTCVLFHKLNIRIHIS